MRIAAALLSVCLIAAPGLGRDCFDIPDGRVVTASAPDKFGDGHARILLDQKVIHIGGRHSCHVTAEVPDLGSHFEMGRNYRRKDRADGTTVYRARVSRSAHRWRGTLRAKWDGETLIAFRLKIRRGKKKRVIRLEHVTATFVR